jgi:pimeloyl-ACP methyl ester carboxylesterase
MEGMKAGASRRALRHATLWVVVLAAFSTVPLAGCSSQAVKLRSTPNNPFYQELQLGAWGGPKPSDRTMQLLRFYNLADDLDGEMRPLLAKLQTIVDREPSAQKVYAMAELAYLGAKRVESSDTAEAMDLYGTSVLHAYHYLFDERLAATRNAYDPQFRGASDLYNSALEGALRIACDKRELVPGKTKTFNTSAGTWDITCTLRGGNWHPRDFDRFEFVSDYEITGLRNHHRTHGLGVPLIAVRRSYENEPAAARYYPPDLSFPVTAFLRPLSTVSKDAGGKGRYQGVLELYDPLVMPDVVIDQQRVPLESDLSTPLAFFLGRPEFNNLATVGLLRPEMLMTMQPGWHKPIMGLYMVQPYEEGKIPVLMVHGLWSSPMTWMEMFNDLRSCPEIRDNYQFWFYLYPTGQPFWLSAAQLRRDLAEVRHLVDPKQQEPALDQMVLIGHSMGGLVSRMQTIDSRDEFWKLVSKEPIEEIKADPDIQEKLRETFYFRPNPSIRRVVTIGTPHRGSTFSNQTTQWLLGKVIQLPSILVNSQQKLFRENKEAFADKTLLKIETSIDSLSPACPVFPVLLAGNHLPTVSYHNVIGVVPNKWWWSRLVKDSDGVVAEESARIESVNSELVVPADHTTVHSHPAAVLEVRRILQEHLAELRGYARARFAERSSAPVAAAATVR